MSTDGWKDGQTHYYSPLLLMSGDNKSLRMGMIIYINELGHMATMPIYGKKHLKNPLLQNQLTDEFES